MNDNKCNVSQIDQYLDDLTKKINRYIKLNIQILPGGGVESFYQNVTKHQADGGRYM